MQNNVELSTIRTLFYWLPCIVPSTRQQAGSRISPKGISCRGFDSFFYSLTTFCISTRIDHFDRASEIKQGMEGLLLVDHYLKYTVLLKGLLGSRSHTLEVTLSYSDRGCNYLPFALSYTKEFRRRRKSTETF